MKAVIAVVVGLAISGCSALGIAPEAPMQGTWRGNMGCESNGLESQDITFRFLNGSYNGSFYGTAENNIVEGGRRGWLRYTVEGSSFLGQVTIKPKKVLELKGNYYPLVFTAAKSGPDKMNTKFCGKDIVFTRVSANAPLKKTQN
ncbi:hypothetical protein [Pseudomonas sp. WS 5011]|uniref:hypothetical protein n=1 Tax=Pseudomonas sp. WS 5011 TaxID=2717477 RepID=UPI001472817A|nr:hypothetical protein [Pseudomonas sp. WS 5011]NMY53468.1 hypothetical protein [Pseudomonas sp. WS 5011]